MRNAKAFAAFVAFLVFICGPWTTQAAAGAKITVTYDEVDTQIAPVAGEFTYKITRSYTLPGGNVLLFSGTNFRDSKLHLGQSGHGMTNDGQPLTFSYRVVNGAIVVQSDLGGFTTLRTIRLTGAKTCVCTLVYARKPGQATFVVNARTGVRTYSAMRAENITCSIEPTAD